ncbi:16S rRNA (guanine(527)-N(7))-methyltransferase RsmG [Treponema pectinovorum]|uniref:16S rRNA (guanine(527)-N(7))-methyltransferase RsmG n=1 Tax=Treponema pectinovorum TaxID=164 RepID=UPI0011CB24B5|nr:16S rRNA (guanine(527)-N(7))-methyltransferase RsmG [Treponema pectinovorum]
MDYLVEGLKEIGFEKGDFFGIQTLNIKELTHKINLYIDLLLEFNAKFDLINTDDRNQIIIRHILDSLSAAPKIAKLCQGIALSSGMDFPLALANIAIADIGSGAGLPGIPLAIAFPKLNFTLAERMSKRCNFLEHCINQLELVNVNVLENQAERLQQGIFDLCVFRAFRPLEKKMTKVLRRILKSGGKLVAYKAKLEKIHEEMELLKDAAPKYTVENLIVPFLTQDSQEEDARERNLVIMEK